eukprot:578016-Hanusia_phi.AAC.1
MPDEVYLLPLPEDDSPVSETSMPADALDLSDFAALDKEDSWLLEAVPLLAGSRDLGWPECSSLPSAPSQHPMPADVSLTSFQPSTHPSHRPPVVRVQSRQASFLNGKP